MKDIEETRKWINKENWYQKIELSNGLVTDGKVSVNNRLKYFKDIEIRDKTFIDIGCNSGGYCLWAKKSGAKKVVGCDINTKRLSQANKLKEIENLEIEFVEKSIFDINEEFDIVFCISVITEVTDVFGALSVIKKITKETAFVEMDIAKPFLYFSLSKRWIRGYKSISRRNSAIELREYKNGYTIAPSIEVVKSFLGEDFEINVLGKGERYDLIKIDKRNNLRK
jgi:ubiquinone/menaquinone biosynthesis C-methylase UbiE